MPRLVVNPDSAEAWEIPLSPGVCTLGRSAENDFPIEHETVSSRHCQISLSGAKAVLKDLGSTAGTFVDGELIEEQVLRPGQMIQLGSILMRFESDAVVPIAPPLPAPPAPASAPSRPFENRLPLEPPPAPQPHNISAPAGTMCKSHPGARARYSCPRCHAMFCDLCVNTGHGVNSTRKYCRTCGGECAPVHVPVPHGGKPPGFFFQLPGVFVYPFRGNGLILLGAGTVLFALFGFGGGATFFGCAGLLVSIFCGGYLFNYSKRIITATAEGEHDPPDWPEFTDWLEDILIPFGQFLALMILTFGPTLVMLAWRPFGDAHVGLVAICAAVIGALLAPMGMLALAMFDNVAALNPIALVWSISRVPGPYLVAAALFELVLAVRLGADTLIPFIVSVPILPTLLSTFMDLYLIVAGMRVLGLLYLTQRDNLNWFTRLTN